MNDWGCLDRDHMEKDCLKMKPAQRKTRKDERQERQEKKRESNQALGWSCLKIRIY